MRPVHCANALTLELLELMERNRELTVQGDFKHDPLHSRRRISQHKNLPAQLVIGDLSGDTGKVFAVDGYFHRRVFDHVLAPVLAFDFARRRVVAAVMINKAEFYGPRSSGFSSDRCEIRYHS